MANGVAHRGPIDAVQTSAQEKYYCSNKQECGISDVMGKLSLHDLINDER